MRYALVYQESANASPYASSPSAFGSPAFSGGEGEGEGEGQERKLTKEEAEKLLATYAPAKKWPKHRLGFMGFVGKKVETISWCKVSLICCNIHGC